ncbi:F0F1 ATP synthase subunit gamma [Sodalis sp. CWE]|uniref:F0F1 ATP synthase subunit gamma n=1 Tax=Sodalis sp. CWE TaxID=2803816 RepID=UPI001C7D6C8B|nr:F0F1 ATP synthase subunit gamma [Sodalis sp. CWE]MBX4181099.1 F0F1 ATP synthase subunit gamma [Sodalis sp. CWE]
MIETKIEIRKKTIGLLHTQKITKAMEKVAVSKMRKSQERMEAVRPYAEKIQTITEHFISRNLNYKHLYLEKRNVKHVGYLVIGTDRGLVGSLNISLFKNVLIHMKEWDQKGAKSELALIGSKAVSFFNSIGYKSMIQTIGIGDVPVLSKLIRPIKIILKAYEEVKLDRIYIANNAFIGAMSQKPQILQILPISSLKQRSSRIRPWDYLYEPDPKILLDFLLKRYVKSQIYQGIIENLVSEQAARMVAMKLATDNSSNLIQELQLIYNRARQSSITQELAEIVSGAEAVLN